MKLHRDLVLAPALAFLLLGCAVEAAPPASFDAGNLVLDPAQVAREIAASVVEDGAKFGAFVIKNLEASPAAIRATKAWFRGEIKPSDLRILDADSPTERAIKTYLSYINGKLVPCGNKLGAKMQLKLTGDATRGGSSAGVMVVMMNRITVFCGVTPAVGKNNAEAVRYTFSMQFDKPHIARSVFDMVADDEVLEWRELDISQWGWLDFVVQLERRPPRVEAVFPGPPQISIIQQPGFKDVTFNEIPRMSQIKVLTKEMEEDLKPSEVQDYLSILSGQGDVDAMFALAQVILGPTGTAGASKAQVGKCIELLKKAAAGGSAEAAWDLCQKYLAGDGVPTDKAKALAYLEIAHQGGHAGKKSSALLRELRMPDASK